MLSFRQFIEESFRFTLKYHNKLNVKLWRHDQLRDHIKQKIVALAFNFAKFSSVSKNKIKDIIITGSNCAYNYTRFSDIDVHLICDVSGLDSDALYDKKVEWSHQHDEKIASYPLEFFVQDQNETLSSDQGIYSLLQDRWLTVPKHLDDVAILKDPCAVDKIQHAIKYSKHLIKLGTISQIEKYKKDLHNKRSAGLHQAGEFSIENVLYKELRNRGIVDLLNDKLKALKDAIPN